MIRRPRVLTLAAALLWGAYGAARAQDAAAVLASDSEYYKEAYEGLKEGLGGPVESFNLAAHPEISKKTKVLVTFGASAALWGSFVHAGLVYGLAPGLELPAERAEGPVVRVRMLPRTAAVLKGLKELQPGMKRLAVFWISQSMEGLLGELAQAGREQGVQITAVRLATPTDLPDQLRALASKPDALWLPPDPLLLNSESFDVLKDYSWSNKVPLYAPVAGLVDKGATASVGASFREVGRAAGLAAKSLLAGGRPGDPVFPERIELVVNLGAARNAGLDIAEKKLAEAARVVK